jgi:hypothetical protein
MHLGLKQAWTDGSATVVSGENNRVLTPALSLILYPRLRHAPGIENLC